MLPRTPFPKVERSSQFGTSGLFHFVLSYRKLSPFLSIQYTSISFFISLPERALVFLWKGLRFGMPEVTPEVPLKTKGKLLGLLFFHPSRQPPLVSYPGARCPTSCCPGLLPAFNPVFPSSGFRGTAQAPVACPADPDLEEAHLKPFFLQTRSWLVALLPAAFFPTV